MIGAFTALMLGMLTAVSTLFVRVLRAEIGSVRTELGSVRETLRMEIGTVRDTLRMEIGSVRTELGSVRDTLGAEIGSLRTELGSLRAEMNTRFEATDRRVEGLDRDVRALMKRAFDLG